MSIKHSVIEDSEVDRYDDSKEKEVPQMEVVHMLLYVIWGEGREVTPPKSSFAQQMSLTSWLMEGKPKQWLILDTGGTKTHAS